jgi:hypothetical protein
LEDIYEAAREVASISAATASLTAAQRRKDAKERADELAGRVGGNEHEDFEY